jgi:hypothetical protein
MNDHSAIRTMYKESNTELSVLSSRQSYILCYVDLLLGNDHEISRYTIAVA